MLISPFLLAMAAMAWSMWCTSVIVVAPSTWYNLEISLSNIIFSSSRQSIFSSDLFNKSNNDISFVSVVSMVGVSVFFMHEIVTGSISNDGLYIVCSK